MSFTRRDFDLTFPGSGLTPNDLTFTRNVETMSPIGERVASNVPRFGRRLAVASAFGPVEDAPGGIADELNTNSVYAAGVDVNGDTLTQTYRLDTSSITARLRVVRINELTKAAEVLTDRTWSRVTGSRCPDLRNIAGTPADDGFLYQAMKFQVVHGSVIAFCRLVRRTGGTPTSWTGDETVGCAFAISNDYGRTWAFTADDRNNITNAGKARGNAWSFQSYWTPRHVAGQPLLEVWLCVQDYFNNPGSGEGSAINPDGGTSYWWRMRRTDTAAMFTPDMAGSSIRLGRQTRAAATLFAWDGARAYTAGERAAHLGRGYARLTNGTSATAPASDPTNWRDIGPSGPGVTRHPAWSASNNYSAGDLVTFNDVVYHCYVTHTANAQTPADNAGSTFGTRWQNIGPQNCQPQGVGMVLREDGRIALLTHESDIGYSSITEVIFDPEDYTTTTVAFNRDGVQDPNLFTTGVLSSTGVTGRLRGMQFQGSNWVGMAPSKRKNRLYLGCDAVNNVHAEYQVGTRRTNWIPRIRRVHGGPRLPRGSTDGIDANLNQWGSAGALTLVISADRSEGDTQGNFTIVGEYRANQQLNSRTVSGLDQTVISRDGGDTWAIAPRPSMEQIPLSGIVIAGNFIYGWNSTTGRLTRQSLPSVVSGRMLNVSCGGTNRAVDGLSDGTFNVFPGRNAVAFASSGQRKIGGELQRFKIANDLAPGSAGSAVGPFINPPPFWHDPANENSPRLMRSFFGLTQGTSSTSTALIRAGFAQPGLIAANQYSSGFALTADHVRVRSWACHAHGLIDDNGVSESWIRSPAGGNVGESATGNSPLFLSYASGPPYDNRLGGVMWMPSSGEWFPVAYSGLIQRNSPNVNDGWNVQESTQNEFKYWQDFYWSGFTEVVEGRGAMPYPLQRSATAGGTWTGPNELATVNGLGLTGSWSTAWAMAVSPVGFGWDQFGPPRDAGAPDWCIGTLYANADNWIELRPSPHITMSGSTVTRESRFNLRIRANGSTIDVTDFALGAAFESEQPIVVGVSLDAAARELRFALSCGGQPVFTRVLNAGTTPAFTNAMADALAGALINEFRLSNNDRSVVDGCQYAGGTCWVGEPRTTAELTNLVRSVAWIGRREIGEAIRNDTASLV